MNESSPRRLGTVACLALVAAALIAAWLPDRRASGQNSASHVGAPLEFSGPGSCKLCHSAGANAANVPGIVGVRDFVRLTESLTWAGEDLHAQAFLRIDGEGGHAMLRRLGVEQPGMALHQENPPNVVRQCLTCHANWRRDAPTPPKFHDFKTEGVSCESCHGPGSRWIFHPLELDHSEAAWRGVSPRKKQEEYGMVDVRNPIERARQCFSCHVGNVSQGKVVTHAMYAAGHPPLPGFEIETFAQAMPPHWRDLPEKGDFQFKADFVRVNFPDFRHDPTQDLPQTKSVLLGGVMALRESVQLLADHAAVAGDAHRDANQPRLAVWPELAVYDCASCHHELRSDSWRLLRPTDGLAPGRPPLPQWPTALVRLGARHRAGNDEAKYRQSIAEFDSRLRGLRQAVAARPFGDPAAVRQEATRLVQWLDAVAAFLANSPYDRPAAQRALGELLALPESEYPDFHSARQIAWAIRILHAELQAPYPTGDFAPRPAGEEPNVARRQRGERDVAVWERWRETTKRQAWESIDRRLDEVGLKRQLLLDLPAQQSGSIVEFQQPYLAAIADYDPRVFRRQLEELAASLAAQDADDVPSK